MKDYKEFLEKINDLDKWNEIGERAVKNANLVTEGENFDGDHIAELYFHQREETKGIVLLILKEYHMWLMEQLEKGESGGG